MELDMCTVTGAACRFECIDELASLLDTGKDGRVG
jgi:hypothetical protein